jgi:hypothetical protein
VDKIWFNSITWWTHSWKDQSVWQTFLLPYLTKLPQLAEPSAITSLTSHSTWSTKGAQKCCWLILALRDYRMLWAAGNRKGVWKKLIPTLMDDLDIFWNASF